MADIVITITDAGREEIVNAANTGTDKVLISEIGIGRGTNPSSASQTALQDEFKRLTTFGGTVVSEDTIHVSVKDTSSEAYDVHEIGLYTDKGTLFAVYSQEAPILEKTATSIMLLSVDVVLQTLDATNITFGDIEFVNPPASESVVGVSRFGTEAELKKGELDNVGVSAKNLKALLDLLQPLDDTLTDLSGLNVEGILSYLRLGEAAKRDVGVGTRHVPDMSFWSSGTGWKKTPDGYIEQWGISPIADTNGQAIIQFNIPFPTECSLLLLTEITNYTPGQSGAAAVRTWGVMGNTLTKESARIQNGQNIAEQAYWRAIGK